MKWKNLRDNFRKELRKLLKSRSGDAATTPTPRWIHFKCLDFLIDIMDPKQTAGNIPDTENVASKQNSTDVDSLFGENTDDPISTVQDTGEVRVSPPPSPQAREQLSHSQAATVFYFVFFANSGFSFF